MFLVEAEALLALLWSAAANPNGSAEPLTELQHSVDLPAEAERRAFHQPGEAEQRLKRARIRSHGAMVLVSA